MSLRTYFSMLKCAIKAIHIIIIITTESRHDCYPYFPRSPLGTPGTKADHLGKTDEKKIAATFLDCRSAKASSTN